MDINDGILKSNISELQLRIPQESTSGPIFSIIQIENFQENHHWRDNRNRVENFLPEMKFLVEEDLQYAES